MTDKTALPSTPPRDAFLDKLEAELQRRYNECPATTTPDTILLAVLNAIVEARK